MELRRTIAIGVFAWAAAIAADPGTPAAGEVRVRVLVRDARGRPVRDLEQPDFSASEDGTNAIVRSVRLVESAEGPARLDLVFDRMRGEPARLSKDAAIALLNQAPPAVQFSIWLVDQQLIAIQPPTGDRKTIKAAIETAFSNTPAPSAGDDIAAVLRASARLLREGARRPELAALRAIADAHQSFAGNKAIVYFSGGLPLAGGGDDALLALVSAASQAGTAIYTVDASGLAITRQEETAHSMAVNGLASLPRQTGYAQDGRDSSRFSQSDRGVAVSQVQVAAGAVYRPPLAELAEKTGGFTIARGDDFRAPMRRLLDELSSSWEVTYTRPAAVRDGRYHRIQMAVRRDKVKVRAPEGFYALPEAPGGEFMAYEAPLAEMIARGPARDFPAAISVAQFRGKSPAAVLVSLLLETPGEAIQFDEDAAASLYRAHLSALAIIRGSDGQVVDRFGRDAPLQCPPEMLDSMRKRRFLFEEEVEVKPGSYTLEIAIQDRLAGRFHVEKTAFTVVPPAATPALSGLTVVRAVTPTGAGAKSDGGFHLAGGTVVPAVDGVVEGGAGAAAKFFFRLNAGAQAQTSFEILKDGQSLVRKPLTLTRTPQDPDAHLIALDIGGMAGGTYTVRISATEEGRTAAAETGLVIHGGAAPTATAATAAAEEAALEVHAASGTPGAPPTAEQQLVLDQTRAAALRYSGHLPNFICTQVTRRLLDPVGKDQWSTLEESSQLVSYYDGKEHYSTLTTRNRAADSDRYPPAMTSTGEFGTLLKTIFRTEAAARFSWVRADAIRGRTVQVFSYSVDAAHTQYRVSHRVGGVPKGVLTPYHGLLFIDPDTAAVLRLTLESDPLPTGFPVRQLSLSLDYGETAVGGQVYNLPLAFTLDLLLHKRVRVRNEVSFRSYQRFTTGSRLVVH